MICCKCKADEHDPAFALDNTLNQCDVCGRLYCENCIKDHDCVALHAVVTTPFLSKWFERHNISINLSAMAKDAYETYRKEMEDSTWENISEDEKNAWFAAIKHTLLSLEKTIGDYPVPTKE